MGQDFFDIQEDIIIVQNTNSDSSSKCFKVLHIHLVVLFLLVTAFYEKNYV